jgi:hypothetical protein
VIAVIADAIRSTYDALSRTQRPAGGAFCGCDRCRDDVLARALAQAVPRYAGQEALGAAVVRVALARDEGRAELAVIVLDAMRSVSASPRHGTAP